MIAEQFISRRESVSDECVVYAILNGRSLSHQFMSGSSGTLRSSEHLSHASISGIASLKSPEICPLSEQNAPYLPRVNQDENRVAFWDDLASVNQHLHHQPRRDNLVLFVARLSSRSSRHTFSPPMRRVLLNVKLPLQEQNIGSSLASRSSSDTRSGLAWIQKVKVVRSN